MKTADRLDRSDLLNLLHWQRQSDHKEFYAPDLRSENRLLLPLNHHNLWSGIPYLVEFPTATINSFFICPFFSPHPSPPGEGARTSSGRARGDRIASRVTSASKGKDPSGEMKLSRRQDQRYRIHANYAPHPSVLKRMIQHSLWSSSPDFGLTEIVCCCWLVSPLLTSALSSFSGSTLWCLIGTSRRAYASIARNKLASARR